VTCHHCGGTGHNRRTCPSRRREEMERQDEISTGPLNV
jgi:hypothetical protein